MFDEREILDSLEEQVAPSHTALVIVDVQNDYVHADGFFAKKSMKDFQDRSLIPGMLASLERLLAEARSAGVLTVFVRSHLDLKYLSPAIVQRKKVIGQVNEKLAPYSSLEGTWGADFYGAFRPDGRSPEVVVTKHRQSAFWGTNLDMILRSNGIKTLVMSGLATSGCVESTTRDAAMNDYYVVTPRDSCSDQDVTRHEASLRKVSISFGYVVDSVDIAKAWQRAPVSTLSRA